MAVHRSRLSSAPVRSSGAGRVKLATIAVPRRTLGIAATVNCDGFVRNIDSLNVGQMRGDELEQQGETIMTIDLNDTEGRTLIPLASTRLRSK